MRAEYRKQTDLPLFYTIRTSWLSQLEQYVCLFEACLILFIHILDINLAICTIHMVFEYMAISRFLHHPLLLSVGSQRISLSR